MQKKLVGNRYRIKGLIGEGGMASVYAALDEKLDRRVAIKILHPHLARNLDIRERFLLEAKTVSTLDHPNIIKVYDFSGLESEQLWMVTEILYGVDLAEYVKRYPKTRLHPIVAILITREVCRALHEAHKLQIVHRDIKPENIMLLDTGLVKLMDFGIAKVHRANATLTGTFMGSPSYMSPEQIRGADVDFRADIYSLCILFYEIVTGVLPYSGQTTAEVINKIMVGRYTAANLLAPDLPFIINEIINKGLKSAKEERFQDILQLSQALDEFLKSFGFGESRVELEHYTVNRMAFDERLANLKMPKTSIARIESHKNILDQNKPSSSRSHFNSVNPKADPAHSSKDSRIAAAASQATTVPPRRARPVDGNHDNTQARMHAPQQRQSSHRPSSATDLPTQMLPQGPQQSTKQQRQPTQGPQSNQAKATIPPYSRSTRSNPFRTPPQKIIIREVVSHEHRRKKSNSSTFLLFGLITAIALVFLFGGDKLMERLQRDSSKVAQQIDPSKKKKTSREAKEEGTPESKTDSPVDIPATVESQSVVIETNKPAIPSEKEVASFKTGRPVITTNKLLTQNNKSKVATKATQDRPSVPRTTPPPPLVISAAQETRPPLLASVPERSPPATDRLPPEPAKKAEAGILKITSLPPAEIYIDGKLYNSTNDEEVINRGIRLDPGNYSLRLKRKGYKSDEQNIQVKAGENRNLEVTLVKAVDLVELIILTNRYPSSLIIEDLKDGGRRKEMSLNKRSMILNLKPGTYRVMVSFDQVVINRVIELKENEGSQTFNADFK